MSGLARLWRRFADRGAGISVPPMDGVFKPNGRLEEAERIAVLSDVDNAVSTATGLLVGGGRRLYRLASPGDGTVPEPVAEFGGPVTFLAAAADGRLAVGVEGEGVRLGSLDGGWTAAATPEGARDCAVSGAFAPDGTLYLCVGSTTLPASAWKRDLLSRGASGAVHALAPDGTTRRVAGDLAFPYGVVVRPDGTLHVAESWRHRVVAVDPGGAASPRPVVADLPAYPARLSAAAGGGTWLALFAPRRQLVELVLREDGYRAEMMATIPPGEWIGPELSTDTSPSQPLQAGSVRQMGIVKPWAPSRSYGLVARCDAAGAPRETWHSRADGTMHGVTSVVEHGGAVYATARGAATLLRLPPARARRTA